jgi:hypothetical protein
MEFCAKGASLDLVIMEQIVADFMSMETCIPFLEPVQWKELGLIDYLSICPTPMDLGTVQSKIDAGDYGDMEETAADMRLIWANCMKYNTEGSDFYVLARQLLRKFEQAYSHLKRSIKEESTDPNRIPDARQKIQLAGECANLNSRGRGKLFKFLIKNYPRAIRHQDEDILINMDNLSPVHFLDVREFVKEIFEKKTRNKRKRGRTN